MKGTSQRLPSRATNIQGHLTGPRGPGDHCQYTPQFVEMEWERREVLVRGLDGREPLDMGGSAQRAQVPRTGPFHINPSRRPQGQ